MRVFFATDIHGSEVCWRKFLNAAAFYQADLVILGGDKQREIGRSRAAIPQAEERRVVGVGG